MRLVAGFAHTRSRSASVTSHCARFTTFWKKSETSCIPFRRMRRMFWLPLRASRVCTPSIGLIQEGEWSTCSGPRSSNRKSVPDTGGASNWTLRCSPTGTGGFSRALVRWFEWDYVVDSGSVAPVCWMRAVSAERAVSLNSSPRPPITQIRMPSAVRGGRRRRKSQLHPWSGSLAVGVHTDFRVVSQELRQSCWRTNAEGAMRCAERA